MDEQRWYAGLPMVGQRRLDADDDARLEALIAAIRTESLQGALLLAVVLAIVIVILLSTASSALGLIVMIVGSLIVHSLPTRRWFGFGVFAGLRRDREARTVFVCRSDDITLEVLAHSHVVWTRNGEPVEPPMVAHATATAAVPEHAAMAAQFVAAHDAHPDLLVHQRALTAEELRELDQFAPRPDPAVMILAVVGLAGAAATFGLALAGRLHSLFAPFAFFAIGALAARSVWRARRRRRQIAADLEAGYVAILRWRDGEELTAPLEVLPYSRIVWTEDGEAAEWRKSR